MGKKIYVVTDMEGVSGVVNNAQVTGGGAGNEKAREWLTLEVNAAIDGALEGGASEVLVLDGHGGAMNLLYDRLHECGRYIMGSPWPDYLPLMDDSFDGLFQIGAHAMAGTVGAVLEHTMSSDAWVRMLINGKPMGEMGLEAAVAGCFDIPFVMMSGDDKACNEARSLVPEVECATVKFGLSRHSAELIPQSIVLMTIREKARAAVQKTDSIAPLKLGSPVEIEIEYVGNQHADRIQERESVRKVGGRRVVYTGKDAVEAFRRVQGG